MPTTKSIITLSWVMAILFAIAGSSISAAKPTLKVNLVNSAEKVVISTSANSPFSVGVLKASSGRFVGFVFKGVLMNSGKLVSIRSGRIRNVKYSSFQNFPPVSRIIVNTTSAPEYTLVITPDKKQAIISIWKQASKKTTSPPLNTEAEPVSYMAPVEADIAAHFDIPAAKVVTAANAVVQSDKLPPLGDTFLANTGSISSPPAFAAKTAPAAKLSHQVVAKVASKTVVVKPKAVVPPKPVIKSSNTKSGPRISLSFSDAEVVDVLKALALQSRRNIVVSKAVGGKITLNLSSVTPEQALNYVTKMSGFSYVKQGETYLVGTKSSLLGLATNDDLNIKVEAIMLSYASPNDVISILQSRFPDLKIRKSDTGWRMLKSSTDTATVSVKTESKKSVGLTQTGENQQSDKEGDTGSGSAGSTSKKQGLQGSIESSQAQSGEDSEATTFTDEVTGRGEQTKDDSNLLIISGINDTVQQAKLLVKEMEKAVYTSSLENTFEIYRIKFVRADGLAEALRQLVPGIVVRRAPQQGSINDRTEVKEGDPILPADRNIIISGRQKDVEHALTIIARLDIADTDGRGFSANDQSAKPKNTVELITVKNIDGNDVLKAITQHFPGLKANIITIAEPRTTDKAASTNKNKLPEVTGSVLVLSGPNDLMMEAKSLVSQMDNALQGALFMPDGNANADPNQQTKLEKYEVRYVSALELATALRSLVPTVTVSFAPSEGFDLSGPGEISLASAGAYIAQAAKAAPQQVAESGKETVSQNVKTLLLLGAESEIKKAMELATTLDVKSPQIKIVAKVTSITENGGKNLGLKWNWGSLNYNEEGPTGTWIRNPIDFGATLDALYTSGDIQILATPSMTILEGKPGVFFVGDEVTYITLIQQTATGQNVQTEKALVGIQLKLNGRVSSDGNITLNLHPEVSTLKLNATSVAGVTLPTISRRFTDQIVRVKDGETYVVGGLIRTDEVSDMTKIPLLGDIPFFGNLFRHSEKTKQKTEVVMFITASIIKD